MRPGLAVPRRGTGRQSPALYTQPGILRDDVPAERKLGIDAGLAWHDAAEASVLYVDQGISSGMQYGIEAARAAGRPIEIEAAGNRDADTARSAA
jgi:hypothetical protein